MARAGRPIRPCRRPLPQQVRIVRLRTVAAAPVAGRDPARAVGRTDR